MVKPAPSTAAGPSSPDQARAQRRYEEDLAKGFCATFEETLTEINLRDKRDVTRADSPLSIAHDALVIDTSELNLAEVFAQMLKIIEEKTVNKAHGLT